MTIRLPKKSPQKRTAYNGQSRCATCNEPFYYRDTREGAETTQDSDKGFHHEICWDSEGTEKPK